ncbi:cupin domain-containing protein [Sulfurihydrogenibium sp.]|uniref:cupin domain-containing protein n=1 Tax=Sulfurihydrogenibium sp. TaxID=2053621 RepID=UPI00261FDDE7|nr:cupin domain-containing protein [Sulfurihydrogenibium sp.]
MAGIVRIDETKFSLKPHIEKIYEDERLRIVLFYLKSGSVIDLHTSSSTVITTVLKGKGNFFIEDRESVEVLETGDSLIYLPNEPHGFEAIEDMVVQTVITPSPIQKVKI